MYIIRIFIAIVFVLAAGYRIINLDSGYTEMIKLGLPKALNIFVIALELIIAFCVISGYYIKKALLVCIGFLTLAVFWGIYINFHYIINNIGELFVFDANPTDIVLHITYIFICIILYITYKNN